MADDDGEETVREEARTPFRGGLIYLALLLVAGLAVLYIAATHFF